MLADTDIWIDYLRGQPQATEFIECHAQGFYTEEANYQLRDRREKLSISTPRIVEEWRHQNLPLISLID